MDMTPRHAALELVEIELRHLLGEKVTLPGDHHWSADVEEQAQTEVWLMRLAALAIIDGTPTTPQERLNRVALVALATGETPG